MNLVSNSIQKKTPCRRTKGMPQESEKTIDFFSPAKNAKIFYIFQFNISINNICMFSLIFCFSSHFSQRNVLICVVLPKKYEGEISICSASPEYCIAYNFHKYGSGNVAIFISGKRYCSCVRNLMAKFHLSPFVSLSIALSCVLFFSVALSF